MSKHGKLEGRITIPSGNWTFDIDETGGGAASATITLTAAKEYYHSSAGNDSVDLVAKIKALLDASALNATYTVSLPAGEAGAAAQYTISASGGGVTAFEITWTDTDLRDLLGFAAGDTVSGALTYTGSEQAEGLWLPDGEKQTPFGDGDAGFEEDDTRALTTASGHQQTLSFHSRTVLPVTWRGVAKERVRTSYETLTNQSFQTFREHVIRGDQSWSKPGGPVRLYWDADDDATYETYWVQGEQLKKWTAEAMWEPWVGQWEIPFDRLVKVP